VTDGRLYCEAQKPGWMSEVNRYTARRRCGVIAAAPACLQVCARNSIIRPAKSFTYRSYHLTRSQSRHYRIPSRKCIRASMSYTRERHAVRIVTSRLIVSGIVGLLTRRMTPSHLVLNCSEGRQDSNRSRGEEQTGDHNCHYLI
jgi:hypothetical protein